MLVTDGVFTRDGRFHPVVWPEEANLEERFRHRFLLLLQRAGRLRPETHQRLLGCRHSGFSVKTTQRLLPGERSRIERLARYLTRVVLAVGAIERLERGRVRVQTAPDSRTGSTALVMDHLDLVHALCQQIPSARMHRVRYLGAYANCTRRRLAEARAVLAHGGASAPDPPPDPDELLPHDLSFEDAPRAAGLERGATPAGLSVHAPRDVFEVGPLLCPRCGVEMETSRDRGAVRHRRDPQAPPRARARLAVRGPRAAGGAVDVPAAVVVITLG